MFDPGPGYACSYSFLGNLHLNVVAADYTLEIEAALEPFVYELVDSNSVMFPSPSYTSTFA